MFCEKCGTQLPDNAKFCEKCGNATATTDTQLNESTPAPICEQPEENTPDSQDIKFCEVCGAQLPGDAKFCEKCGNSTLPGSAPMHNVAAAAAAPSAFSLALKKFFSNKRNVLITAIAAVLIVALIVVLIILACQPKKIYIDDYFDVVFEGAEGYGYAYLRSSDEQVEKLNKLNEKLFPNGDANIQSLVSISLDYGENQGKLKNGDKITVVLKVFEGADEYIDQKIVLRHKTVKVKGLAPSTEINLLDLLTFVYSGTNKYATAGVPDTEVEINSQYKVYFSLSYDYLYANIRKNDGTELGTISFYLDKYENLSNDDVIKVTLDENDYDITSLRESYGIIIGDTSKDFTVSDLEVATAFDPSQYITCTFTGYSSQGYMELAVSNDSVSFGNHTASFTNNSSSYSRRFYIDIYHTGGYTTTVYYYVDDYTNLFNGDTLTFYTNTDVEYIEREYGVTIPANFTVTVSGLTEPITPDVIGKGTLTFVGYEGYGSITYEIPEENRTYTIDGYTFKLTPVLEGSNTTITVVVANSEGENIFVVEYYIPSYNGLSNGDTVTFYSLSYSSDLNEYLDQYGIYFPYEVEYKVSGLKDLISVDPLSQVKFSFWAEDDGSFSTEVEFVQDVFTVGDCLIDLDLTRDGGYFFIYFKVKRDNVLAGSGYYRVPDSGLSNGQTIYTFFNMPEYDYVARNFGILINNEPKAIIVG